MTRINRHILQQLLVLFGFFSLVLVLIYWINRAVRLFDHLISSGQSAWVFVEYTTLSLPAIMAMVLPISAFTAAVYMTNKLSADSELAILQATGHSGARILKPFIMFAIIVCLMQGALQHYLLPTSSAALVQKQAQTSQDITASLFTDGTFTSAADGITLYIESISPKGELLEVMLSDMQKDGSNTIYTSQRAFLVKSENGPKLVLMDGTIQKQTQRNGQVSLTYFDDFIVDIGGYIKPTAPRDARINEQTTYQILTQRNTSDFDVRFEIADRLSKSVAALIVVLLGVSTLLSGSFSRFGIWKHILYAIALLTLTKFFEGLMTDKIQADKSQIWLFALPYVFALGLVSLQLMLRDKPWIRTGTSL